MIPIGDKLVIAAEGAEELTPSGLIIPQTAQVRAETGRVLAMGQGRRLASGERKAMEIAVGDRVIYSKYAGVEITDDGHTYLIISEKDVLCVYAA